MRLPKERVQTEKRTTDWENLGQEEVMEEEKVKEILQEWPVGQEDPP